jgi:hypothetical protein
VFVQLVLRKDNELPLGKGREKCTQYFNENDGWKKPLNDLVIYVRIILKYVLHKNGVNVEWVPLSHVKNQLRS